MSASDANPIQASVNKRVAAHVPKHAWGATVAIVVANRPAVYLLGTGSLFQMADKRFVVTAAHVVKSAYEQNKTIGISGDSDSLISAHGDWICSVPTQKGPLEDPLDVALYPLPETAVRRLSRFRFLRIDDISFEEQSHNTLFSLFGHPGIWSSPSLGDGQKVLCKGLEYTTYAYEGNVEPLLGYQPVYHLLLDAQAREVRTTARQWYSRNWKEKRQSFPET